MVHKIFVKCMDVKFKCKFTKFLGSVVLLEKKGRKLQFIGMFFMANPKHLDMHFHDLMKYICCNSDAS